MSTYTIRYNRTTNHIDGLNIRTAGSQMNYSKSACGSLSRSGHKMGRGASSENLAEILATAKIVGGRKICQKCLVAAEAMIAAQVEEVPKVIGSTAPGMAQLTVQPGSTGLKGRPDYAQKFTYRPEDGLGPGKGHEAPELPLIR
ncbi:hypothetical protein [Nocardia grenadensis]|uniref:hypothetical protein n=1 Tax=Nocardia grenadensis TaxID=931537 RepID=UPI003D74215C